jgi:uncharacterized protein (DUF58 family)
VIVSALLAFMSISGIFGKNNLSRVAVEVEFPDEVFARTPFPLRVTLRNPRKRMPAFLIKVEISGMSVFFPFVDADSSLSSYVTTTFDLRGMYKLGGITISSVFPFDFFIRYRHFSQNHPYIVFPEPRRHDFFSDSEPEKKRRGERPTDKIGYESDMISTREYVHGDPLKYINWKATAKTGQLKTKELSLLSSQPVIIDLDKVTARDLEERVSSVVYTILRLLRKQVPVGLKVSGKLYAPGTTHTHKLTMLRELAIYGTER